MCDDEQAKSPIFLLGIVMVLLVYAIFALILYFLTWFTFKCIGFADFQESAFVAVTSAFAGGVTAIMLEKVLKIIGVDI
jgi:hypothetical protein